MTALLEIEKLSHTKTTDDFTIDWLKDQAFQTTQLQSSLRVKLSTLTSDISDSTQKIVQANERTAVLQQRRLDLKASLEKQCADRVAHTATLVAVQATLLLQKEEADPLNKSAGELRTLINKLVMERDEMKVQLVRMKADLQNKQGAAASVPKQLSRGKKS